jgi:hypothetical protein
MVGLRLCMALRMTKVYFYLNASSLLTSYLERYGDNDLLAIVQIDDFYRSTYTSYTTPRDQGRHGAAIQSCSLAPRFAEIHSHTRILLPISPIPGIPVSSFFVVLLPRWPGGVVVERQPGRYLDRQGIDKKGKWSAS